MATAQGIEPRTIAPQPGPQARFLSTPADIAIYGGGAGGGKTFGLIMEPLRYIANPRFSAVIFRRTSPQIRNVGGLWDESAQLYPMLGAVPRETALEWRFPSGASVEFSHLEYEKDRFNWQGSQVPLFGFDEVTHFTRKQFFYMLSRNRSMCGVKPYIRATCNPDPDSWVRSFISWWIDDESGFAIEERSGIMRWLVRAGDSEIWFNSRREAMEHLAVIETDLPEEQKTNPLSVTFIRSSVFDNKALLATNPGYLANLKALPYVEREQLLGGNWNIRATAGNIFKREWFEIVDAAPASARRVRWWDFAATVPKAGKDPDWTAGAKLAHLNGVTYVEDMRHAQLSPLGVQNLVKQTAELDGRNMDIWIEQEPGSSGVIVKDDYIRVHLQGWPAHGQASTGEKRTRWKPFAAQAEAGNVKIVRGAWNESLLRELEAAPEGAHDDQIDAVSGAYSKLVGGARFMVG